MTLPHPTDDPLEALDLFTRAVDLLNRCAVCAYGCGRSGYAALEGCVECRTTRTTGEESEDGNEE